MIVVKNLDGTMADTDADLIIGTVPAGKEWIIPLLHATIEESPTATTSPLNFLINAIPVSKTPGDVGTDKQFNMVGQQLAADNGNIAQTSGPKVCFATAGQELKLTKDSGDNFSVQYHMSYLERDIPA